MKKNLLTILIIALILVVCFFVGLYILGSNNEAYKFAVKFIDRNSSIIDNIGPLKSHRLSLFGYSVKYNGPHGYAEYNIMVTGERGKGEVYLNLEKDAGEWKLIKGNLVLSNKMIIPLHDGNLK